MTRARASVQVVWDFVVGDDWRIALVVVLALGLTAIVAGAGTAAWWIPPVLTATVLGLSVWRAARSGR